jgi:glycine cleavage system H protein
MGSGDEMSYPTAFRYTRNHEWIETAGDRVKVGITDYAQQQLGGIVYIELPDVGTTVKQGQSFGTIESVKSVSELYAPVSGDVVEVNASLKDNPGTLNATPHSTWIVSLKLSDSTQIADLLDADHYAELVK